VRREKGGRSEEGVALRENYRKKGVTWRHAAKGGIGRFGITATRTRGRVWSGWGLRDGGQKKDGLNCGEAGKRNSTRGRGD